MKKNPREINVHVRLNFIEQSLLADATSITGLNRSELIRYAITMFCNNIIKNYKKEEE